MRLLHRVRLTLVPTLALTVALAGCAGSDATEPETQQPTYRIAIIRGVGGTPSPASTHTVEARLYLGDTPLAGEPLTFTVAQGTGGIVREGGLDQSRVVQSSANGSATVEWKLATFPGTNALRISSPLVAQPVEIVVITVGS